LYTKPANQLFVICRNILPFRMGNGIRAKICMALKLRAGAARRGAHRHGHAAGVPSGAAREQVRSSRFLAASVPVGVAFEPMDFTPTVNLAQRIHRNDVTERYCWQLDDGAHA
jgi:hypothetical protein